MIRTLLAATALATTLVPAGAGRAEAAEYCVHYGANFSGTPVAVDQCYPCLVAAACPLPVPGVPFCVTVATPGYSWSTTVCVA